MNVDTATCYILLCCYAPSLPLLTPPLSLSCFFLLLSHSLLSLYCFIIHSQQVRHNLSMTTNKSISIATTYQGFSITNVSYGAWNNLVWRARPSSHRSHVKEEQGSLLITSQGLTSTIWLVSKKNSSSFTQTCMCFQYINVIVPGRKLHNNSEHTLGSSSYALCNESTLPVDLHVPCIVERELIQICMAKMLHACTAYAHTWQPFPVFWGEHWKHYAHCTTRQMYNIM